jgi:hypothetical protein
MVSFHWLLAGGGHAQPRAIKFPFLDMGMKSFALSPCLCPIRMNNEFIICELQFGWRGSKAASKTV